MDRLGDSSDTLGSRTTRPIALEKANAARITDVRVLPGALAVH
ncbi:MAG TPA: hypothetical protein VL308_07960 [Gemmatimonadaceae bacterium]|nr:hypothetical protein [Gemmatimonadaceae bacterium]